MAAAVSWTPAEDGCLPLPGAVHWSAMACKLPCLPSRHGSLRPATAWPPQTPVAGQACQPKTPAAEAASEVSAADEMAGPNLKAALLLHSSKSLSKIFALASAELWPIYFRGDSIHLRDSIICTAGRVQAAWAIAPCDACRDHA